MTIFGRTEKDLHLLRHTPAELSSVSFPALQEQIEHHCVRLAWRQHTRTGAPVRDVLRTVTGAAFIRLHEVAPIDEFDDELLSIYIENAERRNRGTCIGFMLRHQAHILSRAAVGGIFPPPYSVFEGPGLGMLLVDAPQGSTRLGLARIGLLKLKDMWDESCRVVAREPLARETVRLVGGATGKDPRHIDTAVVDRYLALIEAFIREFEPGRHH